MPAMAQGALIFSGCLRHILVSRKILEEEAKYRGNEKPADKISGQSLIHTCFHTSESSILFLEGGENCCYGMNVRHGSYR